jgi:hypothetical protein
MVIVASGLTKRPQSPSGPLCTATLPCAFHEELVWQDREHASGRSIVAVTEASSGYNVMICCCAERLDSLPLSSSSRCDRGFHDYHEHLSGISSTFHITFFGIPVSIILGVAAFGFWSVRPCVFRGAWIIPSCQCSAVSTEMGETLLRGVWLWQCPNQHCHCSSYTPLFALGSVWTLHFAQHHRFYNK